MCGVPSSLVTGFAAIRSGLVSITMHFIFPAPCLPLLRRPSGALCLRCLKYIGIRRLHVGFHRLSIIRVRRAVGLRGRAVGALLRSAAAAWRCGRSCGALPLPLVLRFGGAGAWPPRLSGGLWRCLARARLSLSACLPCVACAASGGLWWPVCCRVCCCL